MLMIAAVFTLGIIILIALGVLMVKGHRRPTVTWKAGGLLPKSLCCNAAVRPLGWTQDGWTGACVTCGSYQYFGDDFDNPPPGFQLRGARIDSKPYVEPDSGAKLPKGVNEHPHLVAPSTEVTSDTCLMTTCKRPLYRHGLCLEHWDWVNGVRRSDDDDQGEPLRQTPPNIGGEGHPDYAGPHYESVHGLETRFAPYEMLGEPIPGTAVIRVGRTAAVGPIRTEGQGDEDTGADKP